VQALVGQILVNSEAVWGTRLPVSDAVVLAHLAAPRKVRILGAASMQETVLPSLQDSLQSLSPVLDLAPDVESATHIVMLLTGGVLADAPCVEELERAVASERDVLYVYSTEHGWDFTEFYAWEDTVVKTAIAAQEAQVYRARDATEGGGYEWGAMLLEMLRKMRPGLEEDDEEGDEDNYAGGAGPGSGSSAPQLRSRCSRLASGELPAGELGPGAGERGHGPGLLTEY
jgi:hypothetical protein